MGATGTKGVARAERERQILDVAGHAFALDGYAGTSLAAIAAAAGISKTLIHAYFGSKDGLFGACLTQAGDRIIDVIERTAELDLVGPEHAIATLDGIYTALATHRWMWRLFRDPTIPDTPEITKLLRQYHGRMHAVGARGVAELLASAGNTDSLDASALTAAWSSVFDALVTWWISHPSVTPEAMTERTVRLFNTVFSREDFDLPQRAP